MVEIEIPEVAPTRRQITVLEVETWFREAWPGLKSYPGQAQNFRVMTLVQGIADRKKARSKTITSVDINRVRRKEHREAHKSARALQKTLSPVIQGLQSDWDFVRRHSQNVEVTFPGLHAQMLVAQSTYDALERFLGLSIPFEGYDHIDPILVIADLAKEAWQGLWDSGSSDEKHKVRFGPKSGGSLVAFVSSALESIGWAGPGTAGYSDDTISEHLRVRQNRSRVR